MSLRIYNSLSGKKEPFTPLDPGKVRMYVCGPTVYDECHIGHARSAVVFDVIVKFLRAKNYEVTYIRNFTDVDDKIIRRANETGADPFTIAEKYIQTFHADMDALNVERATVEPRATQHIPEIITLIEQLIAKDLAYSVEGDVYFKVAAFPAYGKLSGRNINDMQAGARVEVDLRKENPLDFALWKAAKAGEPYWDSPWGAGRPGWHIECSAMSHHFLGKSFDIHGGGKDLIFPHHENEIAQSEAAYEKPFATYWVHNGFVNINQEKMSKSLGNFTTIKDVLKRYSPEVIRFFLLAQHYRSPVDFCDQSMEEATIGIEKIYALVKRVSETMGPIPHIVTTGLVYQRFADAMDDDFNTAMAIGILFDAVRQVNRTLDDASSCLDGKEGDELRAIMADIIKIGDILGTPFQNYTDYFESKTTRAMAEQALDPQLIEQLIQERAQARKMKDFKTADQIRHRLEEMNIVLEDRPEGTIWKVA